MLDDISSWDVLVGRIKGRWDKASLRIVPFSEAKDRFAAGAKLCAEIGGKRTLLDIKTSRAKDGGWICDCGLLSTEIAESLIGAQLFIDRSMREETKDGEFYVDELFGVRVVSESGVEMGEIEEVIETPNHDVYVTNLAMIPAHPDFIVSRDIPQKMIVVRDVPGLLNDSE
ncbi:16S rRNA processing protein RimM [Abditibacterium utsteinense]|uniref:Ribosome maturation factor RimM n=1 Tax=Abditibacterium utsteinense TaxID=1960156 RepID=A0A2S8SVL2_9BACT|nr:ribosome maturation factor RimM [Abditibacterium utsteinense]PQV64822.1 16S rRNA processing protein RimM [Abditibacterium utsteinense]